MEQQDTTRTNTVKNLIRQIETRPHREAFKKDVQQTQVFNPFIEKLKGHDSQHGERGILRDVRVSLPKLSALFVWRTIPKESYIAGVGTAWCQQKKKRWQANKDRLDTLSIPKYVIHKRSLRERRCGTSDAQIL